VQGRVQTGHRQRDPGLRDPRVGEQPGGRERLVLGTVSAAVGIAGFAYGRTGSALPDVDVVPFLAIAGAVIALTLVASLSAARRALAVPMTGTPARRGTRRR
jgi:hypothetical protein